MSKERIFKKLLAAMAKDGEITSSEYAILIEKGKDLGFDSETVDLLIEMELAETSSSGFRHNEYDELDIEIEEEIPNLDEVHNFKAAITRGGSLLTPNRIKITADTVIFKKRNKHLINVDSISIPIVKISSVELDTGILGTDIIIKSYGSGNIIAKKFTRSDARKIRELISERQRRFI